MQGGLGSFVRPSSVLAHGGGMPGILCPSSALRSPYRAVSTKKAPGGALYWVRVDQPARRMFPVGYVPALSRYAGHVLPVGSMVKRMVQTLTPERVSM